ncbi:hypothetical protein D3C87_2094490 [compost metagenome]
MGLKRAATEEGTVVTLGDGIDAFANLANIGTSHEIGGVLGGVGMRHARHHGRNGGIVGEMGKGVDVVFVGRAQDEPLGQ